MGRRPKKESPPPRPGGPASGDRCYELCASGLGFVAHPYPEYVDELQRLLPTLEELTHLKGTEGELNGP